MLANPFFKKVTEDMGQWRCEKCAVSYLDCQRRYVLQTSVSDFRGTQWVTFFDETAVRLLGIPAQELYILKVGFCCLLIACGALLCMWMCGMCGICV